MSLLIRTIISIVLLIITSLIIKNNKDFIDKVFFIYNMDFSYIRSKSKKIFGTINNKNDSFVSSESIIYKSIEDYHNCYKLDTDYNYVVKSLDSGLVSFIGNKKYFNNTVIVTNDGGIEYIYSNLENINVNLYDYIKKDVIIGSTIDNYLILGFYNNGKYLNYEEFI